MAESHKSSRGWKFGASAGERISIASLQRQDCPSGMSSASPFAAGRFSKGISFSLTKNSGWRSNAQTTCAFALARSTFLQQKLNHASDWIDASRHSRITRRDFFDRASKFAVAGMTAAAILEALSPNYALAEQIAKDDTRLKTEYAEYPSPKGAGKMRGYLARPVGDEQKRPAVTRRSRKPRAESIHRGRGSPRGGGRLLGVWPRRADSARRLSGQ